MPPSATLAARRNLTPTINLIVGTRLVVSVDTGTAHLADALGVPRLAFLSATARSGACATTHSASPSTSLHPTCPRRSSSLAMTPTSPPRRPPVRARRRPALVERRARWRMRAENECHA